MEWIPGAIDILQKHFILLLILFLLVSFVLHILLFRIRIRKFQQDYHRMKEQEQESRVVLQHRNKLRDRNRSYEQSLTYAQRIQGAMFFTSGQLKAYFPESFIYQRPKEIVSGDFNWARRINGKMLFSVADCTGHGVPGAFMSLLGLEYAGAFSPLYIIRDHEILEVKGERIIVGPDYGLQRGLFQNRSMEIQENDMLYLFTDGYPDQFGGPEGKKFKYRRFRHLLMSIHHLPMAEQLRKLEESMNEWMGNRELQIDDQTIMGIRPASFSSS
ncbi:MAG: SpoIIE family protein phosphatase [Bacteroidales bacterium]|nr:SpoIIE family protein phosphatase [Bacteroidales bacterium]